MSDKLPLGRIEDILVEIRDKIGTTGTGGSFGLEEAKQYTDEQVAAALQEAKAYVDAHAQAQNPHNITPSLIGAETPQGAQAKADRAEANAKAYADSLVENMETTSGAQAKADTALNAAKAYTLSLLSGDGDDVLSGIVLQSPGGKRFQISVDDEGNLSVTEIVES